MSEIIEMCTKRLRSAMRGGEIKTYGCPCPTCRLLDEARALHDVAEKARCWSAQDCGDNGCNSPSCEYSRSLRTSLAALDAVRRGEGR